MNQAVQPERRPDQQITNMNNLKRLVSPSTPYDPPEGAIRGPATGRLRQDSTKSSVSALSGQQDTLADTTIRVLVPADQP